MASADVEFATVEGSTSATSQTNYGSLFDDGMIKNSSLVVANPAKWTELARAAYRSYNAAIVASIKDARKWSRLKVGRTGPVRRKNTRRPVGGGPSFRESQQRWRSLQPAG